MGMYQFIDNYRNFDFQQYLKETTSEEIDRILAKSRLGHMDFLKLLSPAAESRLENMAQAAKDITRRQFGRAIVLFTPMYISNYCVNQCAYCGYNATNAILRKHLSPEEVRIEAEKIAETGLRHILVLTGEAKNKATPDYLNQCCRVLSDYFSTIAIEIYPMTTREYEDIIASGVDSLTVYQETYNEVLYDKLHVKGPKKDYKFRLDTPERGAIAGMRAINIGALLGLDEWRREMFFTAVHADYLLNKYPEVEISVSLPRIRPHEGDYLPENIVSDKNMVQIMTALKLFLPRCGITISTRETESFRNNILPLGVTKMSAGVSTKVGGHTQEEKDTGQFEISDERSVAQMAKDLSERGYQPVYQDWQHI
jgi:2-iminoacetate synthase